MQWFVQREFGAAGEPDRSQFAPALFADRAGDLDALRAELAELGIKVVTHQEELVLGRAVGRVHGHLGRGQLEDEPAAARVDAGKVEDVPEERAIGLGVLAVEDDMRTADQGWLLPLRRAGGRVPGILARSGPRRPSTAFDDTTTELHGNGHEPLSKRCPFSWTKPSRHITASR
ncbi:MAG: hypothetical protein QOI83_3664 [Streptomycetaceae bacterium]|nr:hypothetical protein [Streptomycetaceae bacterium]